MTQDARRTQAEQERIRRGQRPPSLGQLFGGLFGPPGGQSRVYEVGNDKRLPPELKTLLREILAEDDKQEANENQTKTEAPTSNGMDRDAYRNSRIPDDDLGDAAGFDHREGDLGGAILTD